MTLSVALNNGLRPDPILTVSEWADAHRRLSQKSSAEAGHWRTSRTPYLKEIMDCLSVTSKIERVVFMKGAQVGGTEAGNNWIGYIIDHAPGPIMSVMPRHDDAKKNSKVRIQPLIDECPRLSEKVKDQRSRDSGNTVLQKDFPGGTLVMTGANSAVGLRSLPARYLFLDEVDGYPFDVDGEGDPVSLAIKRTSTFSRRKILMVSTPTIEGQSKIEREYEASDKRRFQVPCPHCNYSQWLKWSRVKWDEGEELSAWYECESDQCGKRIENWQKTEMLSRGRWVSEQPGAQGGKVAGFHLSSLYSPVGWLSWGELAKEFVNVKGNREELKTFINTALGETWKDKGEAPDWKRLYERRKVYEQNTVPAGVVFLTAGVDVQKDRVEVEIKGWGRERKSWSIDYRVYTGDTSNLNSEAWRSLAALVGELWQTPNGQDLPIRLMAVDSGYNTQVVYSWVRQFPMNKVIAVKGMEAQAVMVGQPRAVDVTLRGRKLRKGLKMYPVAVNLIKAETYGFLKQPSPDEGEDTPAGFCEFPQYGEEYFQQLTAEEMQIKIVRGYKRFVWEKIRDRNEALDCHIYARAAAAVVGMDRFKEPHWVQLESEIGVVTQKKIEQNKTNEVKTENKPHRMRIKRRKSTFL